MHPKLRDIIAAVAGRVRAKPSTTIAAWADSHRHLSSLSSPEPGPWSTDRIPYAREIMECFHPDNAAEWIVFRTGTQVGKTEVLLTVLFFYMHQFPRPMGYVLPNEQACSDFSEQRIDDGIKASPALRSLVTGAGVKDADGRRGKDAVLAKKFPGGMLFMLPATSRAALASKPCGVILCDELTRFPRVLEGEGSPVHVVEHRSQNFAERKIGLVSTPGDEGDSPIDDWYDKTDQCVFDVPCPACGVFQQLRFRKLEGVLGGVVWREGKADQACYECVACGEWIGHEHKRAMLAAGVWRATAVPVLPRARGFHLNALYSPWVSWGKLAGKFQAARRDPVLMRDFVTLDLAEAWRHGSGAAIDADSIAGRAEAGWGAGLACEVPGWVQVLTAFADVQEDRIEISVWGWTVRNEGALVGHWILFGDAPTRGAAVWGEAVAILTRRFRCPSGMIGISAGGIDSGSGSHWDAVSAAIRAHGLQKRRIFATKGLSSPQGENDARPIWHQKIAKAKGRVHQIPINVSRAKRDLSLRLAKDDPPMIRFPALTVPALAPEYFVQLCAEERVRTADATGRSVARWRLKKGHDRNEALDCFVGAYAAFLSIDYRQLPMPCGQRQDLPALVEFGNETEPLPMAASAAIVQQAAKSSPKRAAPAGAGKDLWRRLKRN